MRGKVFKPDLLMDFCWDHPRACGEKLPSDLQFYGIPGSPPRMRGKAQHTGRSTESHEDHPRACGEKHTNNETVLFERGSPPRMRGKGIKASQESSPYGITPAHAGKSCCVVVTPMLPWDHPRACGEKLLYSIPKHTALGSPPRMRGKGIDADGTIESTRITPAHAGKSAVFGRCSYADEDHPRACGEK